MISLVIPVYNEEASLPKLFEAIASFSVQYPDMEAIFIDDGSSDASFTLLKDETVRHPYAKVIRLARNTGQTAAIQAGIDHASGDVLVFLDSDLQNDPADIPLLLAKLDEGYDVVSGWRKDRKDNPIKRNLPSILSFFTTNPTSSCRRSCNIAYCKTGWFNASNTRNREIVNSSRRVRSGRSIILPDEHHIVFTGRNLDLNCFGLPIR